MVITTRQSSYWNVYGVPMDGGVFPETSGGSCAAVEAYDMTYTSLMVCITYL
eukprot:CAMPEP_0196254378 /NCGR_PEP_ID=MMETSP0913-20130531/53812_1 /TAXON_ID=49265 /ORGANISM="Thalassiosira rotula, Strain GSO102" /LENGTH=51 /DNA_ID=CAMNT_0041541647 /DNA_START=94 /DNA_END=249 /DNA_ORIENTATION=-